MGMLDPAIRKAEVKVLKETERTNELLEQILVEVKHANELTRWKIEQQAPVAK